MIVVLSDVHVANVIVIHACVIYVLCEHGNMYLLCKNSHCERHSLLGNECEGYPFGS